MGSIATEPAPQGQIMSVADVDGASLSDLAQACGVSLSMVEDVYVCTPLQLSMIAENRAEVFHFVLSFGPRADLDRFCECLQTVVAANPILRTRLVPSARLGSILQVVTAERHVTERHADGDAGDLERYLEQAHFKMGLGTPLLRSASMGKTVVLTLHHAVFDYWSWDTLMRVDIPALYYGQQEAYRRPAFKDFVARCLSIDEQAARAFWTPRFRGSPAVFLGSSPGRLSPPRVAARPDWKFPLDRVKSGALPPTHVPYFIEAAWAILAAIHTDSDSVAYGYVLSGRTPTPDGLENTLGPAITEVPIQANLQWRTMTVDKLIKDRAASLRQLQQNPHLMHYPLEKIAALSEAARMASGFRALLNIRPAVFAEANGGTDDRADVKMDKVVWLNGFFSLQLIFSITGDGVEVWPRVDTAVMDDGELHQLLSQFGHTLRLLTEVPPQTKLDSLPLLDSTGREKVLQLNKALFQPVRRTLHEMFAAQVEAHPAAKAVDVGQERLSYAQLDERSARLASVLQSAGVTTGTRVGLHMGKSLWAVVAVLAVLRLGGVCVPVDDSQVSQESRAALLSAVETRLVLLSSRQDTPELARLFVGCDVLVIGSETVAHASNQGSQQAQAPGNTVIGANTTGVISDEELSFILPVVGSSNAPGKQKAVLLSHRSLASALTSHAQLFSWGPSTRTVQFWSLASGNGVLEVLGALLFGGCLCIPPEAEAQVPRFINTANVNFALLPPSTIRLFSPVDVPSLGTLVSVGEPMQADAEMCKVWAKAPGLRFFKAWGAMEGSMLSTALHIPAGMAEGAVPESIGTAVGCAVWIVSAHNPNHLAPLGGVGELVIEGFGVASGYVGGDSKTAIAFMPPPPWALDSDLRPNRPTRFFRTGDLARYNSDGGISYVGRVSNRVKLNGGQTIVQLEGVERAIMGCADVREVVAAARIVAGRTQLVAVVCCADSRLPGLRVLQSLLEGSEAEDVGQRIGAVRAYAQSVLPADRVPSVWLAVEKLPRTASHEIDRAAVAEWLKATRS